MKRKGFTLLEILIVMSVFSIIATVVATLYTRGFSVYRHGESHIELQREGRNAIARMTPYISSMFDADLPVGLPMLEPPSDPTQEADHVTFFSTEDWLAKDYPSPTTSSLEVKSYEGIESLTFLYRIATDQQGNIVLERLDYDKDTFTPEALGSLPVTDRRVLLQLPKGEEMASFRFYRPRSTVLSLDFEIRKSTRSDANTPLQLREQFRTTFDLPYSTL